MFTLKILEQKIPSMHETEFPNTHQSHNTEARFFFAKTTRLERVAYPLCKRPHARCPDRPLTQTPCARSSDRAVAGVLGEHLSGDGLARDRQGGQHAPGTPRRVLGSGARKNCVEHNGHRGGGNRCSRRSKPQYADHKDLSGGPCDVRDRWDGDTDRGAGGRHLGQGGAGFLSV